MQTVEIRLTGQTNKDMKRFYSFILLLAFITGTMQPVMPMIEYYLNQENLAEIFTFGNSDKEDCILVISQKNCDTEGQEKKQLLDLDFYPIPLQIQSLHIDRGLHIVTEGFRVTNEKIRLLFYYPNSPPPRLA